MITTVTTCLTYLISTLTNLLTSTAFMPFLGLFISAYVIRVLFNLLHFYVKGVN